MARTATRLLDQQVLTDRHIPSFVEVLRLQEETQVPRVLRISLRVDDPHTDDVQQRSAARALSGAGVWWLDTPWFGGAGLRITMGSTPGITRTVYIDMREGEFVLPPCESVSVGAAWWLTSDLTGIETGKLEISAEIADGVLTEGSPMVLTAQRYVRWSNDEQGARPWCPVPPGAYAWEVLPVDTASVHAQCGPVRATRVFGGEWSPPTFPLQILSPSSVVEVWTDDVPEPWTNENEDDNRTWTACLAFYIR